MDYQSKTSGGNNFDKKSLLIDKSVHSRLKKHCAEFHVPMKMVTELAINAYLDMQEKKMTQ